MPLVSSRSSVAVASLLVLTACPGSSGGDGPFPQPAGNGIEVWVPTESPLHVTASPIASNDGAVEGYVRIFVDGENPPAGTTVTLNGTPLPQDRPEDTRYYRATGAGVPHVAPGDTLTAVATAPDGRSATFAFDCPPALVVSATPDPVQAGTTSTVSWTGQLFHNGPMSIAPSPRIGLCRYYSPGSGYVTSCGSRTTLSWPAASATVDVPATPGDLGFLVELDIPGRLVQLRLANGDLHQGMCEIVQYVPFHAAVP